MSAPVAAQPTSTLTGQIELARLVDTAAQRLKLNIEYDAAALKGQVTLRLDGGLSDDELWQLTNRVLAARGLTTIRQPGLSGPGEAGGRPTYSVVKLADAPAASLIALPADPSLPGDDPAASTTSVAAPPAGYQTVVVRARHRSANDLVDQLGKAAGRGGGGGGGGAGIGGGSVATLGDSGLIVISDLAPRIEQTIGLLNLLDTESGRTVIEPVPAQNLAASQLLSLVNQLAAKREAVSGEKVPGEVLLAADGGSRPPAPAVTG